MNWIMFENSGLYVICGIIVLIIGIPLIIIDNRAAKKFEKEYPFMIHTLGFDEKNTLEIEIIKYDHSEFLKQKTDIERYRVYFGKTFDCIPGLMRYKNILEVLHGVEKIRSMCNSHGFGLNITDKMRITTNISENNSNITDSL